MPKVMSESRPSSGNNPEQNGPAVPGLSGQEDKGRRIAHAIAFLTFEKQVVKKSGGSIDSFRQFTGFQIILQGTEKILDGRRA